MVILGVVGTGFGVVRSSVVAKSSKVKNEVSVSDDSVVVERVVVESKARAVVVEGARVVVVVVVFHLG